MVNLDWTTLTRSGISIAVNSPHYYQLISRSQYALIDITSIEAYTLQVHALSFDTPTMLICLHTTYGVLHNLQLDVLYRKLH